MQAAGDASSVDFDEFGDATSARTEGNYNLGGIGSTEQTDTAASTAADAPGSDFGDFGDFGGASAAPAVGASLAGVDSGDGFFGDFGDATATTESSAAVGEVEAFSGVDGSVGSSAVAHLEPEPEADLLLDCDPEDVQVQIEEGRCIGSKSTRLFFRVDVVACVTVLCLDICRGESQR